MNKMSLRDVCYASFGPLGRALLKAFKRVDKDLEASGMAIHPEVYLSIASFIAILSPAVSFTLLVTSTLLLGLPKVGLPVLILFIVFPPLLVIMVSLILPRLVLANKISKLKIEIPYASMYMSVMVSGGLSPYASLLRLRKMNLMPILSQDIKRIQRTVLATGADPVSAMERAAKTCDLKEYKDLLLGYASTIRTGGDVLHYLYSQTVTMFRDMKTRLKAVGETMGMLMETYMIVAVLGALGLYMIFIVSLALPDVGLRITPAQFFLFAFVVLPAISLVFMYISDTMQINYPLSNWKIYAVFLAMLPLGFFLISQMVLPYLDMGRAFTSLYALPRQLRLLLRFGEGSEPALGLAISLIAITLPVAILDVHESRRERNILNEVTNFLRDLVENRKSGLSPERCIQALASKDYGKFTKHLKRIAAELKWGFSLRSIFEGFKKKTKNWLTLIYMYLLIDTIEVGGGTEESLEALTEFAESAKSMEKERSTMLTPLLIVPYIGAALLTVTTILFLQFFSKMSAISNVSVPYITLTKILLTPLIFHAYMLGMVTGKIISGKTSSGFKHAILLTLAALAGIWIASNFSFAFI